MCQYMLSRVLHRAMKVIAMTKKKDTDTVKPCYQMATLMKDIILMVNAMDRYARRSRGNYRSGCYDRVRTNTNQELVTWVNIMRIKNKAMEHSSIRMGLNMKVRYTTVYTTLTIYCVARLLVW